MTAFAPLARALAERSVRYVMIGVWGANLHAVRAGVVFSTQDRDVFLPPEPPNLQLAWEACEACGMELWSGVEPLDRPRDLLLAERVVSHSGLSTATGIDDLQVDLTLVMAGFSFEQVWSERRTFELAGVEVPVARLLHITESKAAAGRLKDRLFLATHKDALQQLFGADERDG
jgi:hypothetical protein